MTQGRREAAIHQIQQEAKLVSQIHHILDRRESTLAQYVRDAQGLGLSIAQIASAAGLDHDGVVDLIAKCIPEPSGRGRRVALDPS